MCISDRKGETVNLIGRRGREMKRGKFKFTAFNVPFNYE